MKGTDSRSLMLALYALLGGEDGERNAERIVEHVIRKATSGHFGYFQFVLNAVDGKTRPTAEQEGTFEADRVIVLADDGREARTAEAA